MTISLKSSLTLALIGAFAILASYTPTRADSLYDAESGFTSLFSDRKATRVGDVLHILITETAQASQNATSTTSNTTDSKMGPGVGKLSFLPLIGYSGQSAADSKGSTNRSGSFVGRVAVTIIGVTPSGNLLVEGSRNVTVLKDYQVIKLSGEVRPQDIAADNTVPSYKVANAMVSYTGSDPLRPNGKVGIITRMLHWLF
jgi:flagellar L-ring protein FlgH